MPPILAILTLFASASAPAQTVGGGHDRLYKWHGASANDLLGQSVAGAGDVNGDGYDDLIIGSPWTDPSGKVDAGTAFVYSGLDGSLLHQWDGNVAGDNFGHSVAGAGDVNGDGYDDLVVGVRYDSYANRLLNGSAFVYSGFDGTQLHDWMGQSSGDLLGWSVNSAGDVNADGYDDLIVGAPSAKLPNGPPNAGIATVYSGVDGTVLHQWGGQATSDSFGSSVSKAGDVNGDGFSDVIIGANKATNPSGNLAGSAFVYSGATGLQLFQWDGESAGDEFGGSVSGAGDLNGDGLDDLLVGAYLASNRGFASGSAYAYSGADGSQLYRWSGENASDTFGTSVSGAGDFNNDGFADVFIGAPTTDHGYVDSGSAYVFSGLDGTQILRWDGIRKDKFLGMSVADAGDVNADSNADLIVGASFSEHGNFSFSGSAYVYGFNPFIETSAPTISASAGGTLNIDLNFWADAKSYEYKVLISASGMGPTHYGIDIPLTQDSFVLQTFSGQYPIPANGMHGTLDTKGNASASLIFPAGVPSTLIGNTYFLAAIAFPIGQLPEFSSVATTVTIAP
jgi:hypothetical protein